MPFRLVARPLGEGMGVLGWPDTISDDGAAEVFYFDLDHFELAMDGAVLARMYTVLRRDGAESAS
jgi:hypothetical protein